MADDVNLEDLLEDVRHRLHLHADLVLGILDKVGLMGIVVVGQRDQRRRIPGMEMHADLADAAHDNVPPNSQKSGQRAISQFVRYVGLRPYLSQRAWNLGRLRELRVVTSRGFDQRLSPSVSIVMRNEGRRSTRGG